VDKESLRHWTLKRSRVIFDEKKKFVMQSYPSRVLDRRLQEDWARGAKEGPRVLMNLRVDF